MRGSSGETPSTTCCTAHAHKFINSNMILTAQQYHAYSSSDPGPAPYPSSGVRPMVVSTLSPFFTAAMLLPLPRWQVMAFSCWAGLPNILAAVSTRYLWLQEPINETISE